MASIKKTYEQDRFKNIRLFVTDCDGCLTDGKLYIGNDGEFFKVFSDPTRLKILYALGAGELCVFDLSVSIGASVSSVSHNLASLKRARLVKGRRDGRIIYYSLDDDHVTSILQFAREHLDERY